MFRPEVTEEVTEERLSVIEMKRELIKCHENDLLVYFSYPHLPSELFYFCSAGNHDNDTSMPAESNSLCNDVSVVDDQMYYGMLCLSKVQ